MTSIDRTRAQRFWLPIFSRKIAAQGGSHLLMHDYKMVALPQALIHFPAFEWLALPGNALLDTFKRFTELLQPIRILQYCEGPP